MVMKKKFRKYWWTIRKKKGDNVIIFSSAGGESFELKKKIISSPSIDDKKLYSRPGGCYSLHCTCPGVIFDSDPAEWLPVRGCCCCWNLIHHHLMVPDSLVRCCCLLNNRTPEPFVPWTFPPWTRYRTAFVPDSWSRIGNPWTAGLRSIPAICCCVSYGCCCVSGSGSKRKIQQQTWANAECVSEMSRSWICI